MDDTTSMIVQLTYHPEPNAPYRWTAHSLESVMMGYGETAGAAVDVLIAMFEEERASVERLSRATEPSPEVIAQIKALIASERSKGDEQ